MNKDNFKEINGVDFMIAQIEILLESKSYFAALFLVLSLPDILGKLAYSKDSKDKYIKWFDNNVRNITFDYLYSENQLVPDSNTPRMTGEVCYSLRCKLFHEGNNAATTSSITFHDFVLSFTDEDYVRGNYAGIDNDLSGGVSNSKIYFYMSCKGLCKELIKAAKDFCEKFPNLDYPRFKINKDGGKISSCLFF